MFHSLYPQSCQVMAPSLWFAKGIPGIIFMAKQYTAIGAFLKNIVFTKVSWSYSLQEMPYPGNLLDRKLLFLREAAVNIHVCKHSKIAKLYITDWSFLKCVGLLHIPFLLHLLSLSPSVSFGKLLAPGVWANSGTPPLKVYLAELKSQIEVMYTIANGDILLLGLALYLFWACEEAKL